MNFDFDAGSTVTFGVCVRSKGDVDFLEVPADKGLDQNLRDMVRSTWDKLHDVADAPDIYEPADDTSGRRHLTVPMDNDAVALFRDIHEADQFDPGGAVLISRHRQVFCYFARLVDDNGDRLTGMRQSTDFKGVLRYKGRLLRIAGDTLHMVEDDIFKLDHEFDLLIASDELRVLRPAGFETMGQLQQAIKEAVPRNTQTLQDTLGFVNFGPIGAFAEKRVDAARLLASIKGRGVDGITKDSLLQTCADNKVEIGFDGERLTVEDDAVLGFLRTLDRRRFSTELVPGEREVYDTLGRKRV